MKKSATKKTKKLNRTKSIYLFGFISKYKIECYGLYLKKKIKKIIGSDGFLLRN